ncbi:unnamed protein product [Calypogeia fissa]
MISQDPNRGMDLPISEGDRGFRSTTDESLDIPWAAPENQPEPSPRPSLLLQRDNWFVPEQLISWQRMFKTRKKCYWVLLFLSCGAMMTAFPASGILTRLYYVDGGTSKWLISWLAPSGWPITAVFLLIFCLVEGEYPTPLTWQLTFAYAILGFLSAADNLMFAWAYAYLSASTSALLSSTSLIFTAILAYFIVGQKFNSSTVNAVAVMTTAAVILGLDSNSDRPSGVTSQEYVLGFLLTIAGSAMHGLIFALSELLFITWLGRKSFRVALEAQTATCIFATLFTTSGILIAGDFQKVPAQAKSFKHGPGAYYEVLVWSAITYQLGILGSVGCLYLASTLLAGVLNAGRVPVTAIAAVICFNDPMSGFKILAIVLTVWSFASYMWGTRKQQKRLEKGQLSLPPSPFPDEPHRSAPLTA